MTLSSKQTQQKHSLIQEVLFNHDEIVNGIKKLAQDLNKTFVTRVDSKVEVIFLGVLKGCLPFMMELIKHLEFDLKIDFMVVSSYFGGLEQKTAPKLILDADLKLKNCHIVIVEDIIETGKTVKLVKKYLLVKNPKSIRVASLICKKNVDYINPDWFVFKAPQKFLVGFGLDYQEKLRNLNYIGTLKKNFTQIKK